MSARNIWVRGLHVGDNGKRIVVDGQNYLLRAHQHFDKRTVLTVVTEVELPHDTEIEVWD